MEDPSVESFECEEQVTLRSDAGPWTCVVCHMTEIPYYLNEKEGYFIWHRYVILCKDQHEAHPYCYRKWCKEKKRVECPSCGVFPHKK